MSSYKHFSSSATRKFVIFYGNSCESHQGRVFYGFITYIWRFLNLCFNRAYSSSFSSLLHTIAQHTEHKAQFMSAWTFATVAFRPWADRNKRDHFIALWDFTCTLCPPHLLTDDLFPLFFALVTQYKFYLPIDMMNFILFDEMRESILKVLFVEKAKLKFYFYWKIIKKMFFELFDDQIFVFWIFMGRFAFS